MFRLFYAILLFITILGASVPAVSVENPTFAERLQATVPARAVPDFLIDDDKGQSLKPADFKGRFVLMNFWATWCGPCVKEMPALDKLATQLNAKDFQIVAVNENSHGMDVVPGFYAQHELKNLGVYVDTPGRALPLLKIRGLPLTLIIDREGNEMARIEGDVDWTSPDVIAYLKNLSQKDKAK